MNEPKQPPGLKPTYGSAMRTAQIVHWLHQKPMGLSFQELSARLNVSSRTLYRYLTTLRDGLVDEDERPVVEMVRTGHGGRLRFRRQRFQFEGTAYELMSLYLALDLMNFLDGTMFKRGTEEVLERLQEAILSSQGKVHEASLVLKDFHKKFYHWAEAPKDYSAHNETLDKLVKALVLQRFITITYQVPNKSAKAHRVAPLSMLMFKRALYLVGRKETDDEDEPFRDLTFAIERIQKITIDSESFSYPIEYEPQKRFQSSFGLVAEKEPESIILAFDKLVAANVESRRWHPTQTVYREEDETLILQMHTEPGVELISWILSYGAFVQVRSPLVLRDQIKTRLEQALAQYQSEPPLNN